MKQDLPQRRWQAQDGTVHEGPLREAVPHFDVVDCAHCGFAHVLPLPTAEALRDTYAHDYYRSEKPLYIQRYIEDQAWWAGVYRQRLDKLVGWMPAGRRRLLDVGSGPGLFLDAARAQGWQVQGIEPSAQAAAHSRDVLGLDVLNTFLDEQTAPTLGRFDALNMGEVLEHLPDPAAMLGLAHGLLDDGGLLCLVVPNDFNPFQQVLRQHCGTPPWWVAAPHHLNYFNAASLAALVQRCGFEVLETSCTFPIDIFLLMGLNYLGDDARGRQAHGMRMTFEQNLLAAGQADLMDRLYAGFAEQGLGREVVLYARKPNTTTPSGDAA